MRWLPTLGLLVILVLPSAAAYQEADVLSTTASTHQWMMARIPDILRSDGHAGLAAFLEGEYILRMREGTMRADETLWDSREHYMEPTTHAGFLGFRAAGDLAAEKFSLAVSEWSMGDRPSAMHSLGWATHLVQDLTVPHHARLTALDGHSSYEDWVNSHKTDYEVSDGGAYGLGGSPHGGPLDPSDPFDWVDANAHVSFDYFQFVDGSEGEPGNDYAYAAGALLPLAQRTSAGFVKMFFDTVDAGPPVADAGSDIVVEFGTPAYLNGQGSTDDMGIASISWDLGDGATSSGEVAVHVFEAPGTYTARMTVEDLVGNLAGDVATVVVVDRKAPHADAGSDVTMIAGDQAMLDGTGSRDNVGVVNYTWSLGEDTLYGPTVVVGYPSPGIHVIDLVVRDSAGNEDVDRVAVLVSQMPSVITRVVGTSDLVVGDVAPFAAEWDGEDGGAIRWFFGDGGTAQGEQVSHTYSSAGTFRVTAVAWDARGRSSRASMTASVREEPRSEENARGDYLLPSVVALGAIGAALAYVGWRRRGD